MSPPPAVDVRRDRQDLLELLLAEEGLALEGATIPRREKEAPARLSFGQERLWLLDRLDPGNPVYNVTNAVRLQGPLEVGTLQRVLSEIVRRHEVLRSTFGMEDAVAVQRIGPAREQRLAQVDLTALSSGRRRELARQVAEVEFRRPFDLERGPLLRTTLIRLDGDEWVVLLILHHIVSDRWSSEIFQQEIAALYAAYCAGRPSPLAELPVQYTDFALWQREHLAGESLAQLLSYWRERLSGLPSLELPADRPRPAMQSLDGDQWRFEIPASLTVPLRELGERTEATLFMIILSAFQAVLKRYSGQDDLAVGAPIAGRTRPEIEDLIGFFVNTLVLRADLSGNPSFTELVGRSRVAALGAYAHQELPFEKLLDKLDVERTLSRTPLFQVALVLQNVPRRDKQFAGVRFLPFGAVSRTSKFDLTLVFEEAGSQLAGVFEYSTALFDRTTVQRLAAHFSRFLTVVAARPETAIDEVDLFLDPERHQVLVEWNGPERDIPTARGLVPESLAGSFARVAAARPDAVALIAESRQLSYGELASRARDLAGRLRAAGVGPESRVALFLERSIDQVVAILGTLEAGGAYVPIDPSYPVERTTFLVQDSRAQVVLTQEDLTDRLPELEALVMVLEKWPVAASPEPVAPSVELGDAAAYVIYTSGSTGRPKGVVVTHRNVLRLFATSTRWFRFGADDVGALFHSYAFDFSVWELWGALLFGGRLVLVPYMTSRSPESFHALLADTGVTVLNQTPSAFRQLIAADADAARAGAPRRLALRRVVFGGEALDPQILGSWWERHGTERPQLINMYGITETTVHVTCHPLGRRDLVPGMGSPIGGPLPDLDLHVLAPGSQPVPIGASGELHVGGAGLARGYLDRPSLTAERFVAHPFGGPGQRLYRTGDLGRRRGDGRVEYLGRIDDQVKVRGFRIELGEIEAAVRRHPGVRDAVAAVRHREDGDPFLAAWYVPAEPEGLHGSDLRDFVKEILPEHAVPTAWTVLDELPITAHGKVARQRLPEPELGSIGAGAWLAPRTPSEEILAAVWSRALEVDHVGANDNFFALGGDSIRAVRVVALAKQRGLSFSLKDLFTHQGLADLARVARFDGEASGNDTEPRSAPFDLLSEADRARLPEDLEDAYPLSSLQRGMIYHAELEPDDPLYHNINTFCVRAPFREEVLLEAVAAVIRRHPILRTSFEFTRFSEPLQLVHRSVPTPLACEDLRHLDPPAQDEILQELGRRELERRFDVTQPPLLRLHVHWLTDETFQVTLTEFHPILDGWSLQSTLTEIFDHYLAVVDAGTRPAEPPPLRSSYREFIRLERQALTDRESRAFWAEHLRDYRWLELPRRMDPPEAGEPRVARPSTPISDALSAGLHRVARTAAVPLKSVLLAAHLKVLSVLFGQRDVLSGLASHGRPEEEDGDRIRGLFLNTLPMRLRLEPGSWVDLAQRVFSVELRMIPHRRYPLNAIQAWAGRHPLFNTQFNFVNFHMLADLFREDEKRRSMELAETRVEIESEQTHFAIMAGFGSDPLDQKVYLHLHCDNRYFAPDTAQRIGDAYLRALNEIAEHPEARHESFSLIAAEAYPVPANRLPDPLSTIARAAGLELRHEESVKVHLLDELLQPVAPGVVGQLHVATPGPVQPDETGSRQMAELLRPAPYAEAGERWLSTEQLARRLPDGGFQWLGSADQQSWIDGRRLELDAIAAVLSEAPGVRDAVAAVWESGAGKRLLVAWVVPEPEEPLEIEPVRRFVRERLEGPAVPTVYEQVATLTRDEAGRVEVAALLAALEASRPTHVLPGNQLERTIAQVWSEVLGLETIGIHDNFFDLGGQSLLMLQAHRRLEEVLDRKLAMVDQFRFPTVSSLAHHLAQGDTAAAPGFEEGEARAAARKASMNRRRQRRRKHRAS